MAEENPEQPAQENPPENEQPAAEEAKPPEPGEQPPEPAEQSPPQEGPPPAGEGSPPQEEKPPEEQPSQAKEELTIPLPPVINQDALSMEFLYYGSVLKILASTLSSDSDRRMVIPWITKLFRPEYQASRLKDKRNRYLCSLTCNLLNDEVTGVFQHHPPEEALEDVNSIPIEPSTLSEWESDRMWHETLLALPDDFEVMKCTVHGPEEEGCKNDHKLDRVLDQEFQFLLYLTRPYAALLPAEDKTRTAAWLQLLCTIHGEACSSMKAIRNDYIMALLGYLHDLRIIGPFVNYPPKELGRLDEAAKEAAKTYPVIDPTGHEANQFLLDQPVPDDGAFCYVALTGDLVASSLG